MKKLVIHIGYHKTGTTFLNRKFFTNHPQIHHMGKPYSHDDPVREMIARIVGLKKYDVDLCKEIYNKNILPIQEDKIVSISDGHIVKQNSVDSLKDIPKRMLDVAGEVSVIVVIRKQYDYIKSLYVQHIGSNDEKRSFNEWFDSNWERGGMLKSRMNYFNRIKPYVDVLGRDNVGIFIYEQLQKDSDLFMNNLCNFIECDNSIFNKEGKDMKALNKRMTILHYLIIKNPVLHSIFTIVKKNIPKSVHNIIRKSIFSKFGRYEPELSKDRIKLIQEHAHAVNDQLIRKLDLDLDTYNYE
jgi:hypothetical protein